MAYVQAVKNEAGEPTSYRVKWRAGGARDGGWEGERFLEKPDAEVFRDAVNAAGQQWPTGWVKGKGYIAPGSQDEKRFVFEAYARASIANRTGVEDRYRGSIVKELETYLLPTFGNCDVRSTDHFSKATVGAWVNALAATHVWRGSKYKLMAPKTVKNLHGLLSSILKEAVQEEPPLRARNPCDLTRLPRSDDDGLDEDDDGGGGEEMEFMTPAEVEGIASHMPSEGAAQLVRDKYAMGTRWGEITAVARRHLTPPEQRPDGKPHMRIARAWKRSTEKGFYLGKPKSKRSRRSLRVDGVTWGRMVARGVLGLGPGELVYQGPNGGRWIYSTFYDQWQHGVKGAKAAGLLPEWKFPTPHDLRHSHAAALLSAGHSPTYVQRRLGHESIKTTSDRYGHLLPVADDDAMRTIERSLGGDTGAELLDDDEAATVEPTATVYAAHLGSALLGFVSREVAEEAAAGWAQSAGSPVRVETWSLEWWQRSVPGGAKRLRTEVPGRAWVWRAGPVRYAGDGTECAAGSGAPEPVGRWVWDFEPGWTDETAVTRTEWVPGEPVTEAEAWGLDREAVRAAYERARTDALRVCGLNPVGGRVEAAANE
ncbi:tyrosine-type recombinase/integrase [Streptomyces sp. NPDC021019]|uniref:tyrosine-type recombinase/integrase n=1 Tax=Streptomyces sp. NPDC021019 TaxID=3365108 RepID=UPI0037927E60